MFVYVSHGSLARAPGPTPTQRVLSRPRARAAGATSVGDCGGASSHLRSRSETRNGVKILRCSKLPYTANKVGALRWGDARGPQEGVSPARMLTS